MLADEDATTLYKNQNERTRGFIIDAAITNPRRQRKKKRAAPLSPEACSAPGRH
jgi:hypothetical protein